METATKNRQSEACIQTMVQNAFPGSYARKITELTEGFFNVAYNVALSGGDEIILKIAPPKESPVMTHEKNIMWAEVECMRLVKSRTKVPVADVLYYDNSRSVCSSDYFFMSKINGRSLNSISAELSEEAKAEIDLQAGKINAEINRITGSRFGYFAQEDRQGSNWFEVFSGIIHDVLNDAKAFKIDIGVDYDEILGLLAGCRSIFEEVTVPKLVHWDLWAGNIFTQDGEITGIIDLERCLWADELMEVGFRSYNQNENFLKGYGVTSLTPVQQERVKWYDLYLFLVCALECDYRQYPNHDQLIWAWGKIREVTDCLQNGSRMA